VIEPKIISNLVPAARFVAQLAVRGKVVVWDDGSAIAIPRLGLVGDAQQRTATGDRHTLQRDDQQNDPERPAPRGVESSWFAIHHGKHLTWA
jgi:hypothetical protein